MSKTITLIDADSLCYIGKSTDSIQTIIQKVDEKINNILDICQADYYCLFISKGRYFRYDLTMKPSDDVYKGARTYDSQPYKQVIKAYLEAQWGAVSYKGTEADDAIAYFMNKKFYANNLRNGSIIIDTQSPDSFEIITSEECSKIMTAVDKDLLKSIPGHHLNYNKKTGVDSWEMVWVETSEIDANNFIWEQMITGDTSDGIKGIPGKGISYFNKLFQPELKPVEDIHEYILTEYVKQFGISQGIYEFQKNYRLLHMLNTDEDWMREVGYIPSLPEFREVIKQNTIIKNEF
jgi:hypothetical protein